MIRGEEANPYQPSLVRMHDHWTPEQIAQVITDIDVSLVEASKIEALPWGLSKEIVLRLSVMPQVDRARPQGEPTKNEAITKVEPEGIGKCSKCHVRDAVLMMEWPLESDRVQKFCEVCVPRVPEEEDAPVAT